jgi:hypothetical protein
MGEDVSIFLTWVLVEGEWSASRSGSFTTWKELWHKLDRKLDEAQILSDR